MFILLLYFFFSNIFFLLYKFIKLKDKVIFILSMVKFRNLKKFCDVKCYNYIKKIKIKIEKKYFECINNMNF